ncbi:MAG: alkylation response protein AidB-like acyl-CoA dehydrogenase [Paraglaciecola sp.]|jgi:alkylation response protein AidB-like acyl-CoA dehydrogenase
MSSTNHAWCQYPSLSSGAISTINAHASQDLKQTFLPKLIEGKWSGTMCLTEAMLALLTPVAKGFLTEMSLETTSNGILCPSMAFG